MAITLVSAAVGLGLYLQFGLSLWNAGIGALALYVGLICVHVFVRRSEAIRELSYEVDRLETEVVRLARGAGQRPPMSAGSNQQLSSLHSAAQAAPPAGAAHGTRPAPMPGPVALHGPVAEPPANAPTATWGGAAGGSLPHGPLPAPTGPAAPRSAAGSGADARSASDRPMDQGPAEERPGDPMARFWSVRPTAPVIETPQARQGVPKPLYAEGTRPALSTKAMPVGARADASQPDIRALAPPTSKQQMQAGGEAQDEQAVEGDVNVINDMIRMFSEEIALPRNAPPRIGAPTSAEKAPQDRSGSGSGQPAREEAAISASVGALRAAADEMRRPAEAARPAIERGVLPPFRTDPTSAIPQPPPVGPEHAAAAAMADAIAAHKLDVFLEPIVGLADRKARHFDVSLRLRNGESGSIGPEDYIPMARGAGLLPLVDATRAARAAMVARHMDERGSGGCLFSSITADSLTSERFLGEFAEACRQAPKLRERLVFSIGQSELRSLSAAQWATIRQLAGSGFRFALEDVASLDLDLPELKTAGFAFMRVRAQALLDGVSSLDGVLPAAELCQRLAGAGLTLIAVDLNSEDQLDGVLGAGVPLGQGSLFGVPRPIRADALRPARTAA